MKKTDDLQIESLRAAVADDSLALYVYREIDSTNNEAKRLAMDGVAGYALIAAESQTGGRGRLGRSFYSPAKTGIYFSVLYTPASFENAVTVTSAAAVAVMEAIEEVTGTRVDIKWVNDLYLNDKKVCGILTESLTGGDNMMHVIVGIGINMCTDVFPAELSSKAGSLGTTPISRTALIAAVWNHLKPYLQDPSNRSWLEQYRSRSCVIGKHITWVQNGESHFGYAEGIDDTGALEVRGADGVTVCLRTGEISVLLDPVK